MENCLVAKLKKSVQSDSLEELGYVTIHVTVNEDMDFSKDFFRLQGTNYVTLVNGGQANTVIKCLNTDVSMTLSVSGSDVKVFVNQMPTNGKLTFKINKYDTTFINVQGYHNTYSIKELSQFFAPCTISFGNNNFTDNTLNSLKDANASTFAFSSQSVSGSINVFSNLSQVRGIDIRNCSGVNGDLSAIKDLPNLVSVIFKNTSVTDNDNTVTYLRNRGVSVTFENNA